MDNTNQYLPIDKIIIEHNNNFLFNLYTKSTKDEEARLVYENGVDLSINDAKNLLDYPFLYVEKEKKGVYQDYYKNYIEQKIIPKNMKSFYEDVSKNINSLFDNPESIENVKEAKVVVTDMVNAILQDDFKVESFVSILSSDYYTHTHSLNVSVYSLCIGKHMGMDKKLLEELGISALLHDLGKTKINPEIINKNGKLTDQEFKEVQNHPFYGWLLAKKCGITNTNILAGIRNHHEKIDGTGYPDGLFDKEIHVFAKIIGVCDVFDALTTKRTYKDSVSTFDTIMMMKKEMSNHLDEKIINQFIQILKGE